MTKANNTPDILRNGFIGICALISAAGIFQSTVELSKLIDARKQTPFFFAGLKVAGINKALKGEKYIGYYSDQNFDKNPKALAQFAQFQLEMAPLILDNVDLNHRFLILDCQDPANAMKKLQELQAKALSRNNYGTILAVREKF
jgi:hypothetical protein